MTSKKTPGDGEDLDEGVRFDEQIQRRIGAKLRGYYDELLNEAIPDKFIELLVKLDEIERKEREGGSDRKDPAS